MEKHPLFMNEADVAGETVKDERIVREMSERELKENIAVLFHRCWEEELSEEDQYALEEEAEKLVAKYGWSTVYEAVFEYLQSDCTEPESVINFAHLYWVYGWQDYAIPNPYDFLGYLYYRIEMDTEKYDETDILDSIATSLLPKSGYPEADLYENPSYLPETDPLLSESVEKYRIVFQK